MRRNHDKPGRCAVRASGAGCRAALALAIALLAAQSLPAQERGFLFDEGLTFSFDARDETLARQLWPRLIADRRAIMAQLRLFPEGALRVVLAPTQAAFQEATGGVLAEALGVYIPRTRTIVLRSPRTRAGGEWDVRGVARHELAHGILDLAVQQPIPRWLNEGLAILVSGELSFLDDSNLAWLAFRERLIPLPLLMATFPEGEQALGTAYAQAASFARFLLRRDGMTGLRRLLEEMAAGQDTPRAFTLTYGQSLASLEAAWQAELSGNFSWTALVTPITVLGGIGAPLAVIAFLRRRLESRRRMKAWPDESGDDSAATPGPESFSLAEGTPGFGLPLAHPPAEPRSAPRAAGRPFWPWRRPRSRG